jgi:hypothetical protein
MNMKIMNAKRLGKASAFEDRHLGRNPSVVFVLLDVESSAG